MALAGMYHHFQPVVSLDSGGIVGYEALMRIPGRSTQTVLAELCRRGDADLLRALDEQSVKNAAAVARDFLPRGCRLFINLTHASLEALVAGAEPPPTHGLPVVWELAESAATAAVLARPGALSALAGRFTVALDDVGDGRSDLWRLSEAVQLGLSWIKVARSLVDGCAVDPGRQAVLRSVAALGVPVVAEGAERWADVAAAGAAGVRHVQGFVLGRPAPAQRAASAGERAASLSRALRPIVSP